MATSPRWKSALDKALSKSSNKSQTYSISTADLSSPLAVPRVRTVVHRAFLTPDERTSPLFLTTTDTRAQKVNQILADPASELVWWLPDTLEQFRVTSTSFIVPSPQHPSYSVSMARLKVIGMLNFDWETERKRRFNDMSPYMRASWARPPPGSPIPSYDEAKKWPESLPGLEDGKTKEDIEHLKFAFSNFALLILDPNRVDYVEFGVQPNQRTIFTKLEGEDRWQEQIVVP